MTGNIEDQLNTAVDELNKLYFDDTNGFVWKDKNGFVWKDSDGNELNTNTTSFKKKLLNMNNIEGVCLTEKAWHEIKKLVLQYQNNLNNNSHTGSGSDSQSIDTGIIYYIDKLDYTSKHIIDGQEIDVQHCRFDIEKINNSEITHILLDERLRGSDDSWDSEEEYFTFNKEDNTTMTWTNWLSDPTSPDPPLTYLTKIDGTDKYKFNLTAIIDDDISHLVLDWPKTNVNDWTIEYLLFNKGDLGVTYTDNIDIENSSDWTTELKFDSTNNRNWYSDGKDESGYVWTGEETKYVETITSGDTQVYITYVNQTFMIHITEDEENTYTIPISEFVKKDGTTLPTSYTSVWQDSMLWDSTNNMYTGQYKLTIGLYDGSLFAITQDAQNPQNPETYHVKISNLYVGTSTSVPFIHTKLYFNSIGETKTVEYGKRYEITNTTSDNINLSVIGKVSGEYRDILLEIVDTDGYSITDTIDDGYLPSADLGLNDREKLMYANFREIIELTPNLNQYIIVKKYSDDGPYIKGSATITSLRADTDTKLYFNTIGETKTIGYGKKYEITNTTNDNIYLHLDGKLPSGENADIHLEIVDSDGSIIDTIDNVTAGEREMIKLTPNSKGGVEIDQAL